MRALDRDQSARVPVGRYDLDLEIAVAFAPLTARAADAAVIGRGDWRALRKLPTTAF